MLRLDRLRALAGVYPGAGARGRDGRRVRLLPARQGRRGPVHRHRDARAGRGRRTSTTCIPTPASRSPTAADGEALTRACFGDRVGVGAVAAARASSSAWTSPRCSGPARGAIGVILGGHGITAWGATSDECEANSLEIIATAQRFLDTRRPRRSVRPGDRRLRAAARSRAPRPRRRAGAGHPRAGLHRPAAGRALHRQPRSCSTSWPGAGTPRWPRSAPPARTTSCAPRSRRWCSTCRPPRRCRR